MPHNIIFLFLRLDSGPTSYPVYRTRSEQTLAVSLSCKSVCAIRPQDSIQPKNIEKIYDASSFISMTAFQDISVCISALPPYCAQHTCFTGCMSINRRRITIVCLECGLVRRATKHAVRASMGRSRQIALSSATRPLASRVSVAQPALPRLRRRRDNREK